MVCTDTAKQLFTERLSVEHKSLVLISKLIVLHMNVHCYKRYNHMYNAF